MLKKIFGATVLLAAIAILCIHPLDLEQKYPINQSPQLSNKIHQSLQNGKMLRVMVRLNNPKGVINGVKHSSEIIASNYKLFKQATDELISNMPSGSYEGASTYVTQPLVSLSINEAGYKYLINNKSVNGIYQEQKMKFLLDDAKQQIKLIEGLSGPNYLGLTGKGTYVVVVDKGVDVSPYPDRLPESAIETEYQACIGAFNPSANPQHNCPATAINGGSYTQLQNTVINGSTFGGVMGNLVGRAYPCDPVTECNFHGNVVADLIAGRDITDPQYGFYEGGYAEGATILPVRMAPDEAGLVSDEAMARALDYILQLSTGAVYDINGVQVPVTGNKFAGKIASINFSLGGPAPFADNCFSSVWGNFVDDLAEQGIATVVTSGGPGWGEAVSFPACVPNTLIAAASSDMNSTDPLVDGRGILIGWATNRSRKFNNIFGVPAHNMRYMHSRYDEGQGYHTEFTDPLDVESIGTPMSSLSSPAISGSVALIKEAGLKQDPQISLNPSQIRELFYKTGIPSVDEGYPTINFDEDINVTDLPVLTTASDIPYVESGAASPNGSMYYWYGWVKAIESKDYQFVISSPDGFKLWVNDEIMLDAWKEGVTRTSYSEPLFLQADVFYPIKIAFVRRANAGTFDFSGISTDGLTSITDNNLYPPNQQAPGGLESKKYLFTSKIDTAGTIFPQLNIKKALEVFYRDYAGQTVNSDKFPTGSSTQHKDITGNISVVPHKISYGYQTQGKTGLLVGLSYRGGTWGQDLSDYEADTVVFNHSNGISYSLSRKTLAHKSLNDSEADISGELWFVNDVPPGTGNLVATFPIAVARTINVTTIHGLVSGDPILDTYQKVPLLCCDENPTQIHIYDENPPYPTSPLTPKGEFALLSFDSKNDNVASFPTLWTDTFKHKQLIVGQGRVTGSLGSVMAQGFGSDDPIIGPPTINWNLNHNYKMVGLGILFDFQTPEATYSADSVALPKAVGGDYSLPFTTDIKANGQDGSVAVSTGSPVTISWSIPNSVGECDLSGNQNGQPMDDVNATITASGSYTFTYNSGFASFIIYCKGPWGKARDSVFVNTTGLDQDNYYDLFVNGSEGPIDVVQGSTVTLTWGPNAGTPSSCVASGSWTGSKALGGGSQVFTNITAGNKSYILTCTIGGNPYISRAYVNVQPSTPILPSPTYKGSQEGSWKARYYLGTNFDQLCAVRDEVEINHNWDIYEGIPCGPTSGPEAITDNYSMRITGQISPAETGNHTVNVISDEKVRVWVGEKMVINHWTSHTSAFDQATVNLVAGKTYPVMIEYAEVNTSAVLTVTFGGVVYSGAPASINQSNVDAYMKGLSWWNFDETAGSVAYDQAAGNASGNVSGATRLTSGCKFGNCYSFDGVNDYIAMGDTNEMVDTPMSLSLWVKAPSWKNNDNIIAKFGTGGNFKLFADSAGKVRFGIRNAAGTYQEYISNTVLTTNVWHHILVTYNISGTSASTSSMYIDNIFDKSNSFTIRKANTTSALEVGRNSTTYFLGQIDDIKIYPWILTTSQKDDIYNGKYYLDY